MLGGHSIKEQVMTLSAAPGFTKDFIPLMMIMSQKSIGANMLLILRTTFGALVCGFGDPQGKQWIFLFVVFLLLLLFFPSKPRSLKKKPDL